MEALARRLGIVLDELGLTAIEGAAGEMRVRLERAPGPGPLAPVAPLVAAPAAGVPLVADAPDTGAAVPIAAPMVGTFYRGPSPGAAPFVAEGDVVAEGQTVCIIEAMKLMNEIESQAAGRIVKVLVADADVVEYGQSLFLVEPAG